MRGKLDETNFHKSLIYDCFGPVAGTVGRFTCHIQNIYILKYTNQVGPFVSVVQDFDVPLERRMVPSV